MNCLDLAQRRVKLKKAASTNGGEWQGPCPGCGGDDRFHVWPAGGRDERGSWWCRGCGKGGDAIQFLREFEGRSYAEACAELGIDGRAAEAAMGPALSRIARRESPAVEAPRVSAPPAEVWRERAGNFIRWAADRLSGNPEALAWLAARGIDAGAAVDARLGWNPGEDGKDLYRARTAWGLPEAAREDGRPKALWLPRGLVIPYVVDGSVLRVRIRRPEGEPRYYVIPGSAMDMMICGPERRAFVLVESELDAVACAAATDLAGACALGSASARADARADGILREALFLLDALDRDRAGLDASRWWRARYPRWTRWPVPVGKDPGEASVLGMDLKTWIEKGLPPALTLPDDAPRPKEGKALPPRTEGPEPKGLAESPPGVRELYGLLRSNPSVVIHNEPDRLCVLRDGKYVGGRIHDVIYRDLEVMDYLLSHPADRIDGNNLIV